MADADSGGCEWQFVRDLILFACLFVCFESLYSQSNPPPTIINQTNTNRIENQRRNHARTRRRNTQHTQRHAHRQ